MKIEIYHQPDQEFCHLVEGLERQVFDSGYQAGRFTQEAKDKKGLIGIVAFENSKAVAFKVGYALDESTFYSWLGGVVPEQRKRGIARQLFLAQQSKALELGFKKIRTTSRNSHKPMIILNLKMGFDIIGVHFKKDEGRLSIVMEKNLTSELS